MRSSSPSLKAKTPHRLKTAKKAGAQHCCAPAFLEPVDVSRIRYLPWQRLYFLPLLQGHLALRPILPWSGCMVRFSLQNAQVQAAGWSLYQLVLVDIFFLFAPEKWSTSSLTPSYNPSFSGTSSPSVLRNLPIIPGEPV